MAYEGLGESSRFMAFHPLVTTAYYALVLVCVMISNSLIYLAAALLAGLGYTVLLKGTKTIRTYLVLILVVSVFSALINGLFTHNGATVLFYLGPNRVTLEAFVYGFMMAMMISAVICWFASFSVIMTADKQIYLFGRIAPVIGLVISMIFRFIPLLRSRYQEIEMGLRALGATEKGSLLTRIRRLIKRVSILTSWSLEASIDSADSMAARGYGLRGRTSFHLFRWNSADSLMVSVCVLLGCGALAGHLFGAGQMRYYPVISLDTGLPVWARTLSFAAFAALLLLPMAVDLAGEWKWKKSLSTI